MIIVIDGNDGTGKTTIVNCLRGMGYAVKDRGMPSQATLELNADFQKDLNETYIILDVPVEVSKSRLISAGRDMTEHWHTDASLVYYRDAFQIVAEKYNIPVVDSMVSKDTLNFIAKLIGMKNQYTIGIPKGRLFDSVASAMTNHNSMISFKSERNYHLNCENVNLDCWLLKPRSIPQMVALGILDGGFCGKDLIEESGYKDDVQIVSDLGTQKVKVVAIASNSNLLKDPPRRAISIATEFPNIAIAWAMKNNIACVPINSFGSTEAWIPKFCDMAIDVCETGTTIKENGLHIIDHLMDSSTVFIANKKSAVKYLSCFGGMHV